MKFKVGDVCQIREWDDMEREFGISPDGSIKADAGFVSGMRGLCGKKFIIESAYPGGGRHGSGTYTSVNRVERSWHISGDMLKYYGESEWPEDGAIVADPDQFASFLDEIFS